MESEFCGGRREAVNKNDEALNLESISVLLSLITCGVCIYMLAPGPALWGYVLGVGVDQSITIQRDRWRREHENEKEKA